MVKVLIPREVMKRQIHVRFTERSAVCDKSGRACSNH